jgi:hypothetical protein
MSRPSHPPCLINDVPENLKYFDHGLVGSSGIVQIGRGVSRKHDSSYLLNL